MPRSLFQKKRPAILATSVAALLSGWLLLAPPAEADEYWDGTSTTGSGVTDGQGGDGIWDATSTTNWVDSTGHTPSLYTDTVTAHFATMGGVVTLGSNITFGALDFDVDGYSIEPGSGPFALAPNGTVVITVGTGFGVTFDAQITGAGGLDFEGGGTITLTNVNNAYLAGTNIGSGTTVVISSDADLGDPTSVLTFDGGTLQATASVILNIDRTITLNGAGGTFSTAAGNTLEIDGQIGGTGDFTVTGGGTILLTDAANNYSGATVINSATTLSISSDSDLGNTSGLTINGGTLAATAGITDLNTITLNGGATFTETTGNILQLNGVIQGTGGITVSGGGTILLGNTGNTYSGATDIGTSTTLSISSDGNLGNTSGVVFDGGILQVTTSVTMPATQTVTVNSTGGTVSLTSGNTFEVDGVISGTGKLTLSGNGTVVFTNTGNVYSGGTDIGAGITLQINDDAELGNTSGALIFDGGTLQATASVTSSRPVTVNSTGGTLSTANTLELGGVISGTGELTVTGGGTIVLTNTGNGYSGGTDIGNATTLQISSDSNLGNTAGALTFNGGTLHTTADVTSARGVTLDAAGGTVAPDSTTTLTLNGVIQGAGPLTMAGAGTFVLGGANTYTGTTTISTGTLQAGATNVIPSKSAVLVNTGAILNLNGFSQNVGSIADGTGGGGTINVGTAGPGAPTLTAGNNNTSTSFSGAIQGNGGGLTKVGTGTLTLSGLNTYTGATTVNGGTLVIDTTTNPNVLSSASALVVGGGTFQLNGVAGTTDQVLNGLTVNKGSSEITIDNTGTTTTLDLRGTSGLMGITRNTGGFVDFTPGTNGFILTNQANNASGIIGNWATVNGGAALAANNGADVIVAYTGYTNINALGPNTVPNNPLANVRINALGTAGPVPISQPTTTINTLTQNFTTASTIDTSAGKLVLGTGGGLFITPGSASLTIGIAPGSGTLTSGGDLLFENDSGSGASTLTINSVVANGSNGALNVVVQGNESTVFATANTYTGTTTISGGTLQTNVTGAIPITSAVKVDSAGTLNLNNTAQSVGSIADGPNGGGTINLGSGTLTTGSDNTNTSYSGLIEGAGGGLVKVGTGTLVISNIANSYSGGTTLTSGTLIVNGNPADGTGTPLGSGTLTIKGGTLATTIEPTSGTTGTNITNPISVLGNFSIGTNTDVSNAGAQNITLSGVINLNGATRTITGITNMGQVHFGAGGIGTAGETAGVNFNTIFTKTGQYVAFIFDPNNVNQYTGLTTVNNGAFLVLQSTTAGGSLKGNIDIEGNGVVDYDLVGGASNQINNPNAVVTDNSNGNVAGGAAFAGFDLFQSTGDTIGTLNGHGTVGLGAAILTLSNGNFSGFISDGNLGATGGGINKVSAGTFILSGAAAYTGPTTIAAGTLQTNADFATSSSSAVTIAPGATFDLNGHTEQVGSIADGVGGGGTISLGSGALVAGFDNTSTTFSGVIQDGGVSHGKGGSFIKVGTGTLTLSGTSNTYTGQTFISAGTLLAGAAQVIPSASTVLVDANGTFDLNSFDQTVGAISGGPNGGGTISLGSATLTAGGNNSTTLFGGVIQDGGVSMGTGGSFVKTGIGTLFLTGDSTYTGTTTVNGGTLDLSGFITSPVTVNAGATFVLDTGGKVEPSVAGTTPVTLNTQGTFHNFSSLTNATGALGVAMTGSFTTVVNEIGGSISSATAIDVTTHVAQSTIVNYGTITGTGGTAIDAHNSDNVTYGDFGKVNGFVILSPIKNTVLLATGFPVESLAGPAGANNTLRLTGGSTGNVNLSNFPNYQALQKVGGGLWTTTGTGTFVNGTSVTNGILSVGGNLISNVTTQGVGEVGGLGFISGNLANFGVVSPGIPTGVLGTTSMPGTLSVKGGYQQGPSGTLVIQVNGTKAGQYSTLAVSGAAQLGGTLQIGNGGKAPRFKLGQKLDIITASGGLSGRFANIINNSASNTLVTEGVAYESNAVVLEGVQGSFRSVGNGVPLTPNQSSVANALDKAALDPRAAKLVAYLDTRNIADLPADFDRIAPEEVASIYRIGTSLAEVQARNIQRRTSDLRAGTSGFSAAGFQADGAGPNYNSEGLAGPNGADGKTSPEEKPPDLRWGTFITGVGDFIHVGSTENSRSYDLNSAGFTLGADYKLTPNLAVGVSAGYAGTDSRLTDDGRIRVNGGKLGVYGTYYTGGFYSDVSVSGGVNDYSIRRGGLQGDATGSTQGREIDAAIDTGYDWKLDALTIGPTASFEYTYMGIDGFTERGSLAPLRYDSQGGQSARTTLGLKASYDWKIGNVLVRPEIQINWQHEFADRAFPIDASLASGAGSLFTVTDSEIARDSLLLGGGVAVLWNARTSTYLYYDADLLRKEYSEQSVTGGLKVNF